VLNKSLLSLADDKVPSQLPWPENEQAMAGLAVKEANCVNEVIVLDDSSDSEEAGARITGAKQRPRVKPEEVSAAHHLS